MHRGWIRVRLPRTEASRARVCFGISTSLVTVLIIYMRLYVTRYAWARATHRMRMVLRQQIREKDAMIDNLLSRVNPGPTMATPLTLVPARLPLSSKERTEYRDILTYLERAAQQAGQRVLGDGRARFDISALEDIPGSDEDTESDEEMVANAVGAGDAKEGSASPKRGASVEHMQPVDTVLELMAPTGMMAAAALQTSRAATNAKPDSSSESSANSHGSKGVAGDEYFLPGSFLI